MFHQIYELMVLGMHPAIPHPRRSQIRPQAVRSIDFIVRPARSESPPHDWTIPVVCSRLPARTGETGTTHRAAQRAKRNSYSNLE